MVLTLTRGGKLGPDVFFPNYVVCEEEIECAA